MIGAIAGDIVGSRFERQGMKQKCFDLFHPSCRFTDDTVLSVAIADVILHGHSCAPCLKDYVRRYPSVGYGGAFLQWARGPQREPYGSWGNGAAMRISPVGFAFDSLPLVLANAKAFSEVTHNHPEGIKGAQATAASVFLARTGSSKEEIQAYVTKTFGYELNRPLEAIRPHYGFDVSSQGSVPQAIRAFLESESVEDAIRNAISLGGDADTQACIAGGIAEAFFGKLDDDFEETVFAYLDSPLAKTVRAFRLSYPLS
jgi:ADP-ribosylglycohydrolase